MNVGLFRIEVSILWKVLIYLKLYMISLGGKVKGANIEVHDVQFLASDTVENTVNVLKKLWYGEQNSLHMDSYKNIRITDGHSVSLSKNKPDQDKRLFFVYLGKYETENTQELHYIDLIVADNEKEAKSRALRPDRVPAGTHVDMVIDVEKHLHSTDDEPYYIILDESSEEYDVVPDWKGFKKLNK